MTSTSQPTGFAAYFAATPSTSSAPLIHGLTSPPRTDSPSDSKVESSKVSVDESPAPLGYGASTPAKTPPSQPTAATTAKKVDISSYTKRAWRLVHDPELHPKGSVGRGKPKEIRQSGQGVVSVSDPRKLELKYGAGGSKGKKKYTTTLYKLHYQFDTSSLGPPPPAQIVIWGFSPLVTSDQVQNHFRPFGEIQELDLKVDPASGQSLGVCRIKYKVDKKDMMSGHASAKKAVQEGPRIKLGGSIISVDFDKDGLKTIRHVGEAIKKKHAPKEPATPKEPPAPKVIPTGPAADRKPSVSHTEIPPPPPYSNSYRPNSDRVNDESRRSIDSRTPLHESSRSRRTSPSPPRSRQTSHLDTRYRPRSPDDRHSRYRSPSPSRERVRLKDRSPDRSERGRGRSRDRSDYRDRSLSTDGYRSRRRSRSRSTDRRRDRDDRRHLPRRRSVSRSRERRYRSPSPYRRRRSPTPPGRRVSDEHDRPSSSSIDEYRPSYSARFRPGVDDLTPSRERDRHLREPSPSPRHSRRTPLSDRDDDRGRSRKRTPPRTRSPSMSSSSPASTRKTDGRRRGHSHTRSPARSPTRRLPLLSVAISQKVGGRPYIFISDCDLPVRRFSSRDLGLCFKSYHPSVYDDDAGFYIAFHNYTDARECYAAHGDGKSFIDGYRLRMRLIDDKESIIASRAGGSPPRRKPPPPKKTVEEEAVDAIVAELKEAFIKDVRSRIVNPMLIDLLDPGRYKDIQPTSSSPATKVVRPEPKITVTTPTVKREMKDVPLNRQAISSLLPRFRKKGMEPAKGDRDRKPTKADLRPMHHQFNYYSDSEEEDRQREGSVVSEDEDESSRPSRETTSLSTPEPSRLLKAKSVVRAKDVISVQEEESEEELLKDIIDTTSKDEVAVIPSKRKRVIDFTSSEDEEEPTPPKKVHGEPEISDEAMQIDEHVTPQLSKKAVLKAAKAKAAAIRRAKKAEAKGVEDSITTEEVPVKEIKVISPPRPKIPEVILDDVQDDEDMLLDLDGVQTLVRDKEDWRYFLDAISDITAEQIKDIYIWAWKQKTLKALNFEGARGPMKIPEPPVYNRVNLTGSARTEGYVKITEAEKSLYLPQRYKAIVPIGSEAARKTSRMNRVNNRRLAADMEVQKKTLSTESDILRFNQLKARKKHLKFARSPIHDWGLFAMEDIDAHEMVIEYVGEMVRFQVAELREKQYERVGIGSSYLFRVDDENIIDATKTGNIARFINHCCTPNCSAKIIQVQGEKKIVIYADRFIAAGEEITYDYKFPREDVKIPCFCGSAHCKGTLN